MRLNKSENSISRESGIELLKIIATFLICIAHCTQTLEKFADYTIPSDNISFLIMKLLRFGGQTGNLIFIICSSYFLINSKKAKKEKAINLLMDSQFISVSIFVLFCTAAKIMSSYVDYSFRFLADNIFPDLFEALWFIPAYVILYLSHPFLNKIIYSINQRTHFSVCLCIFVFYGLLGLINIKPAYSDLLGFFFIYFIVAYMKLYCTKWQNNIESNVKCLCLSAVLLVLITSVKNCLGLRFEIFAKYPELNSLTSVILLPLILSAFNIFKSFKFKSRFINYVSSCSLFFYCIHENKLFREKIRPKIYSMLIERFGDDKLLIYIFILTIVLFVSAYIASAVYKETFHKLTVKLSIKAKNIISKFIDYANLKFSEIFN